MTETGGTGESGSGGSIGDLIFRWQSLIGTLFGFAGVIVTLAISAELALDQERLRDHLDRRTAFEQSLALSALLDAEVRQRGNTLCAMYTRIPQHTDIQGTTACPAGEATSAGSSSSPFDVASLRAWTPRIQASVDVDATVYSSNLNRLEVLPPESVGPILDYYSHLSALEAMLKSALGTHDTETGAG